MGMTATLAGPGDVILLDADSHASIYAGVNLSGAEIIRYKHNNPEDLAKRLRRLKAKVSLREPEVSFLEAVLGTEARRQGKFLPTIVLRHLDFEFGVVVDKLVGPREIVLRKLGPLLEPLDIYSSATISGANSSW